MIGVKRSRSSNGQRTHVEARMPISYNTAFKIVGPTPRVQRVEKKVGRSIKFPDEAVREARRLSEHLTDVHVALELAGRWPGITGRWVRQVREGVIRANVK